ncbi:MAG: ABC transporter ATP-binding protein/permease [Candidatus Bathyarchaeota archaeon]|nr:ABC transporter ATP-binding protein/permease [Candidatus Bathyarchaeota archaeon]
MVSEYDPSDWELTKRLLGYMKPFMGIFIGIVLTAFGRHGIFALIAPLIVALIIDFILVPVPGGTHWFIDLVKNLTGVTDQTGLLIILCSLIVLLAVIRGFFHVIHITLRAALSQNILRVMRRDFYYALIHKSFSYLDQVMSGQIISRITSDMGAIDLFYSETVREIFRHGMQFLFTVYILYIIDPSITLICCIPMPFIFLSTHLYSSRISGYLARAKNQFGNLNNVLIEGIVGHKLIKTHGMENHFFERFQHQNEGYVDTSLQASRIQSIYRPSSAAMVAIGIALVIYYGGQEAAAGHLSIGEIVLFGIYFAQLVGPMRMFARLIMFYNDAIASARRVFEVIDIGEDVPEAQDPVRIEIEGEINYRGVSFSYGEGRETLQDITLRIESSQQVALMGYVGSGKTTLAELVPRFYDVTAGSVTVDNVDVREIELRNLRKQVGIVLQDVFIFSDTIRNNIAYGKPEATEEEIVAAAKAAQIHEHIESLPDGYDTVVGERGITLSGGQRQRVSIARTLLTDPRILILDDSTSNVDAQTEVQIRKAIDVLLQGRTALIITQRASTCEVADKVVVMENGRIIAEGKHRDLLKSSSGYRRLIESQELDIGRGGESSG